MALERRPQNRRFSDDCLELIWAALQTLDVALRHVILRELATDLETQRLDPRSAQGRIRAAILSLNHAADVLGHPPTQAAYRDLRRLRPELQLMPDSTVRRILDGPAWSDCLRRALLPAPSEGDFVKKTGSEVFTQEEVIEALTACTRERGGIPPTFHQYLAWASDPSVRARPGRRPLSSSPFQRFGGFRAILVRCGLAHESLHRVDSRGRIVPLRRGYTDEEMLDAVRKVAASLGVTPRSVDYRDSREAAATAARAGGDKPVPPSLVAVVERFGTWAAALELAGLPPLENMSKHPASPMRRPQYSLDEKIEWLRRAWVAVGAPFTPGAYHSWRHQVLAKADDAGEPLSVPSCDCIVRTFGGWRKAREVAVPPEPT